MSTVFHKFPRELNSNYVTHAQGVYISTKQGKRILDTTAGGGGESVLGYSNEAVIDAINAQMRLFSHMNYNVWQNEHSDKLADLLISSAPAELSKVYFSGNSGSEAVEAALKLSYQAHYDSGSRNKNIFISRKQSTHGQTLHGIALSDRDILDFYDPIVPHGCIKIPQHHPLDDRESNETLDEYAQRSANELRDTIIKVGPEKVASFVGETVMGALQGDVPPAPNYWKYVRDVCDEFNVHLILDECYCGLGRSGKIYCCEWDDVSPDFICLAKTLAAGYVPLSAVVTTDKIYNTIANGQGRIQHGHTHQGHSLGVAAALAAQKIIHSEIQLDHITTLGEYMRNRLKQRLCGHPFFKNIRGRGLMFSLEYQCRDRPQFGAAISRRMLEEHDILIDAKWHRIAFTPAYIFTKADADHVIDSVLHCFEDLSHHWGT